MKSDEKFEQLYSNILTENMQKLEYAREEAKRETIIIGIIGIIIGIIFFWGYNNQYILENIEVIIPVLEIIGIYIVWKIPLKQRKKSKISEYKNEFKITAIKAILNSFCKNIGYAPIYGIGSNNYKEAEFEEYDAYREDDFMTGILENNCKFEMSEVVTEKYKYRKTGYTTLFCGLFAKIETPKIFNANLYLRKGRKDIFGKLPFEDLRVHLDSQEFEECFDVFCSDKIIAMQLLTPDIMQLLVDFQREMNMEYELTIKNNYIYIRFMSGKMFEAANVNKFSLDKKMLYKYYKIMEFSFALTNQLISLIKETEYDL